MARSKGGVFAMTNFSNTVAVCFCVVLVLSPVLAAERKLLDPDWNDPAVAKARAAVESAVRARATGESAVRARATGAEEKLSLPRWGMGNRIDRPTPDEQ